MSDFSATRRSFLSRIAAAVGTAPYAAAAFGAARRGPYRVGVIGHTGRGNFGHGLDTVWLDLSETSIVGVADADSRGLQDARQRLRVAAGYADYRTMLRELQPDLVAVCCRHPDQHRAMTIAAIEAGAQGVYVEKPFCRTPGEADAVRAACEKHSAKVAVAHRNRYHPVLEQIDGLIQSGRIGKVLELRGRGKGDQRGGSEDLWVLGSHVMDLLHYFGGPPTSCSAVVRIDGRPVVREDVRPGNEALGPLAGNEVHARFEMANGVIAYFDSIANDGTKNAGFGLQIVGSAGVIRIACDRDPLAHLQLGNPFKPSAKPAAWQPISSAGVGQAETRAGFISEVVHHVVPVRDLIDAIETDRQPRCGVAEGAMTVEMICSVFASHQQGGRAVDLPLSKRDNALTRL